MHDICNDFQDWMVQIQSQTEADLSVRLPPADSLPKQLSKAMRYAVLGGGKRVRPLLAHAAGELTKAPKDRLFAVAASVELIHAYSLIHDDLPCMDDDVLRRGRPTCHVEFGEATALLAGDALQSLAFSVLASQNLADPAAQLEMVSFLAHAAGFSGMVGGQAIDLAAVGQKLNPPELELMHTMKTGALIRASVLLGALCGNPLETHEKTALDAFAKRAGLLFQVVDDILDCTATTASLGKTSGKDEDNDKPTYVSLLGLSKARQYAKELHRETLATLECFGAKGQRLTALTHFICQRQF